MTILPMRRPVGLARCNGAVEAAAAPPATPRSLLLRDVMREHIIHVLTLASWTIEGPAGAATLLGMKPSTLRYRMRILGIRKPCEPDPLDQHAVLRLPSRSSGRT